MCAKWKVAYGDRIQCKYYNWKADTIQRLEKEAFAHCVRFFFILLCLIQSDETTTTIKLHDINRIDGWKDFVNISIVAGKKFKFNRSKMNRKMFDYPSLTCWIHRQSADYFRFTFAETSMLEWNRKKMSFIYNDFNYTTEHDFPSREATIMYPNVVRCVDIKTALLLVF